MSIESGCSHCGATLYYADWIFIDTETEDVRCRTCQKVNTVPVEKNPEWAERFMNAVEVEDKSVAIISKEKLIKAAEACKTCHKDCDRCHVIEGCGI